MCVCAVRFVRITFAVVRDTTANVIIISSSSCAVRYVRNYLLIVSAVSFGPCDVYSLTRKCVHRSCACVCVCVYVDAASPASAQANCKTTSPQCWKSLLFFDLCAT